MIKKFQKNEAIIRFHDKITQIGIVHSGKVQVQKLDERANTIIVDTLGQGGVFGLNIMLLKIPSPVNVVALENCEIEFVSNLENALEIVAAKNAYLNFKVELLSQRSLREKILFYLKSFKSNEITLEYTRAQLAEFLAVDRASLSRELSKMSSDGLITFHKDKFVLL